MLDTLTDKCNDLGSKTHIDACKIQKLQTIAVYKSPEFEDYVNKSALIDLDEENWIKLITITKEDYLAQKAAMSSLFKKTIEIQAGAEASRLTSFKTVFETMQGESNTVDGDPIWAWLMAPMKLSFIMMGVLVLGWLSNLTWNRSYSKARKAIVKEYESKLKELYQSK